MIKHQILAFLIALIIVGSVILSAWYPHECLLALIVVLTVGLFVGIYKLVMCISWK